MVPVHRTIGVNYRLLPLALAGRPFRRVKRHRRTLPTKMPHKAAPCASRSVIWRARVQWILTTAWASEVGDADQAHVSSSAGSGGSTGRLRPSKACAAGAGG